MEHTRIFYFHNRGQSVYWLASVDWIPPNFDRRVETAFSVLDPTLQLKLKEILEIQLSDTEKGWQIQTDGSSLTIASDSRPLVCSEGQMYEIRRTENDSSNDRV